MPLEERDIEFEGTTVHVWEGGSGFPVMVLHGSGAGASIVSNFERVLEPLGERYRILAADLVGFGQSGLKPEMPYFDVDMWLRQGLRLADRLPDGPIGVIGHSLSGAFALKLAARTGRIAKVMATGTMGASFEVPEARNRAWTYPETDEAIRGVAEHMVVDKSIVTDRHVAHRKAILTRPGYREYFRAMFEKDRQHFVDASAVTPDELSRIGCDVLFVHGRQDASFPPDRTTLALARAIPTSDVVLLSRCGHNVAYEQPGKFLRACEMLFG